MFDTTSMTADYSQYEKSTSRRSNSPAGSRRNRHGSEVSEDERSYRSNGSGGRGMSGHPSIPTIAIQDTGDSSFSEGEYYSGSERLHRQALEANMYRNDEEIHQTVEFSTRNPEFSQLPINEKGSNVEEGELEIGKSSFAFCEVDQSGPEESQDEMVEACVITTNAVIENDSCDSLKEMAVDQKQQVISHEEDTMDGMMSPSIWPNIERSELENLALRETEEGLLLATASGIVQQVLIGAKRQLQEEMLGSDKTDSLQEAQESPQVAVSAMQPEISPAADPNVPVAQQSGSSLEEGASASTSKSPGQLQPSTATIKIMTDLTGAGLIRELKLSQELCKDPNTGQWVTYRNGQLVTSSGAENADQGLVKGTSNGHAGRAPTKKELGTVPDVQVGPPLDQPAAPLSPFIEVDIEREPPRAPRVPEGDERTTVSSLNEEFKSVGKTDSLQKFTSRSSTSSVNSPVERRLSKKNMLHKTIERRRSHLKPKGSSSSLTSLYSTGEEFYGKYPITGDVSFGLGYNFKTNVFEVKIGGCRDLVPIDAKKNKSDPYIKTYLLPDKSKNSKRKTRTKKGTINPNYSENLKYPIAQSELETRTLSVAIWHYDRFGHNMFLGEVLLPLDGLDLTSYPVKWHQLKTRVAPNETKPISYKGDIVLALMFETLLEENKNGTSGSKSSLRRKKKGPSSKQIGGCLKIHIKEAKNLTPPKIGAVVNPYVKVYLEPDRSKTGKKKTSTMRNTLNPSYEQSLEFPNVTQDILKERALEVGIWDSEIGSSSLLGGVRLGSGTGKSYGRGVEWQDSTGIEIQLWEEMLRNHNQWVEACLTLRASFDKDKKT